MMVQTPGAEDTPRTASVRRVRVAADAAAGVGAPSQPASRSPWRPCPKERRELWRLEEAQSYRASEGLGPSVHFSAWHSHLGTIWHQFTTSSASFPNVDLSHQALQYPFARSAPPQRSLHTRPTPLDNHKWKYISIQAVFVEPPGR